MFLQLALKVLFGRYYYKINKTFVKTLLIVSSKSGQRLRNGQKIIDFLQENISEKDKKITRITKRTDKTAIDIYYDSFIKNLLGVNVIIRNGKNNVTDLLGYFQEYLFYRDKYYSIVRKIFIISIVFFVAPVINLVGMSYVIIDVMDIPSTIAQVSSEPVKMPLFEYAFRNATPIIIILAISVFGFVYLKKALDTFRKIYGYDILEGYILNLFSLIKIEEQFKNGKLMYFDYYELLIDIVNDLYRDRYISEENYVNYVNYLEYKKNEKDAIGKKILTNSIIEDNLDVYARMSVRGEQIGFYKIFDDVLYNFQTFRSSYTDSLKIKIEIGEEVFKGILGVWWISTTVFFFIITAYLSICTTNI